MDRGPWQATVPEVAKRWKKLSTYMMIYFNLAFLYIIIKTHTLAYLFIQLI